MATVTERRVSEYYLPPYRTQFTGSRCAWYNSNMAAAAMLGSQATLGKLDLNADVLRDHSAWPTCDVPNPTNEGTSVADAAAALFQLGVHLTVYTGVVSFATVEDFLWRGRFLIGHGDYSQVPWWLRGSRLRGDADFYGPHTAFFQEVRDDVVFANGTKGRGVRVGDGLNDARTLDVPNGYVWWPIGVAQSYMEKFGKLVFAVMDTTTHGD